jgi:hypothetical protein
LLVVVDEHGIASQDAPLLTVESNVFVDAQGNEMSINHSQLVRGDAVFTDDNPEDGA